MIEEIVQEITLGLVLLSFQKFQVNFCGVECLEKFIDELLQHIQTIPPSTNIEFMHLGGAIRDVPKDATAFYFREAAFELHAITNWKEEKNVEEIQEIKYFFFELSNERNWGRKLHEIALCHSTLKGGYVNINTEGLDSSQLYQSNYQRLREIKTKYDPGTVLWRLKPRKHISQWQ